MSAPNDIILYHYSYSPYGRRIVWYLTLRQLAYAQCPQPPTMPRPDLDRLGVSYRRIPVLALHGDIICDTRLILSKLESQFPYSSSATPFFHTAPLTPSQRATASLLASWTIDGGIFQRASTLLPPDLPLMRDPKFSQDRASYTGGKFSPDALRAARPESLSYIRLALDFLEQELLSDGRDWVLGTQKPSMADIEAIWPFHWLFSMPGALTPPSLFSAERYPRVHSWIARFEKITREAKSALKSKTVTLNGEQAATALLAHVQRRSHTSDDSIDAEDPVVSALGLKKGDMVESWPIDSGMLNKDRGRLVKLDRGECVVECERTGVRVRHPRWNFRVRKVGGGKL